MMLVLDTHAVVWWTLEPARLGRAAARALIW
jgi:PIN domain nuclease of toxin-antitoxin system